jgi:hypothetical protein
MWPESQGYVDNDKQGRAVLITYFDEVKYHKGRQPYYWLGGIAVDASAIRILEEQLNSLAEEVFGVRTLSRDTVSVEENASAPTVSSSISRRIRIGGCGASFRRKMRRDSDVAVYRKSTLDQPARVSARRGVRLLPTLAAIDTALMLQPVHLAVLPDSWTYSTHAQRPPAYSIWSIHLGRRVVVRWFDDQTLGDEVALPREINSNRPT